MTPVPCSVASNKQQKNEENNEEEQVIVDEPVYLDGPAEQEFILDENEQPPIDDDDDNWEDEDNGENENALDEEEDENAEPEVNDSIASFTSHTDSIYKIAHFNNKDNNEEILCATASGDDSGYLWKIKHSQQQFLVEPLFHLKGGFLFLFSHKF